MAKITIEFPNRVPISSIKKLKKSLEGLTDLSILQSSSSILQGISLILAFSANALQVTDILVSWLRHTPRSKYAEINLSDGRIFKIEANTDPDEFVKQLKIALSQIDLDGDPTTDAPPPESN